MSHEAMHAGEAALRRRQLIERIAALPDDMLIEVETKVSSLSARVSELARVRAEAAAQPVPGAQRVVGGATITERPDLVYAGRVAGGPVTAQAPEPEHPAELAKVGAARR